MSVEILFRGHEKTHTSIFKGIWRSYERKCRESCKHEPLCYSYLLRWEPPWCTWLQKRFSHQQPLPVFGADSPPDYLDEERTQLECAMAVYREAKKQSTFHLQRCERDDYVWFERPVFKCMLFERASVSIQAVPNADTLSQHYPLFMKLHMGNYDTLGTPGF